MRRLKIVLVFISLFLLRWTLVKSPLGESWTPESKVRFTATILTQPEYTDSKTIIRNGIWYISYPGYAEIIPGSRVAFVGKVEPRMLMGQVTQIVMQEPTFEVIGRPQGSPLRVGERAIIMLGSWRERWVGILEKTLPEPMSSLAAGILLGVKGQMPGDFYQALVNTGTLHIVAASGYNVSVVASVLMAIVGGVVSRAGAIMIGLGGILLYVLIAGGSASVVRAGIMGSLTLIAYYLGRPAEARRLLWVTGAVMLLINPLLILDIGFQLSFGATAGLLYLEPGMRKLPQIHYLKEYLYPTLAATLATFPIILYHFGRVSWISPLVNVLVLPAVPLIMGLSAFVLVGGQVVAWLAYVPLAYVVWVIRLFGR